MLCMQILEQWLICLVIMKLTVDSCIYISIGIKVLLFKKNTIKQGQLVGIVKQ